MKIKWFNSLVQERKTEVYRYISLILNLVLILVCFSLYYIWNTIPEYDYEINSEFVSSTPHKYKVDTEINLNINNDNFVFGEHKIENGSLIQTKVWTIGDTIDNKEKKNAKEFLQKELYNVTKNATPEEGTLINVLALMQPDLFDIEVARDEYVKKIENLSNNILKDTYPDSINTYNLNDYKHLVLSRMQCQNKNQSWASQAIHSIFFNYFNLTRDISYDVDFQNWDNGNRSYVTTRNSVYDLEYGRKGSYSVWYSNNNPVVTNTCSTPLNKPYFYRLYDISQGSFDFHFQTNDSTRFQIYRKFMKDSIMNKLYSVENMNLTIDFGAPVSLLPIYPQPDEIGKSFIKYNELSKIDYIYQNGLSLHAQFPIQQNIQIIRLFFLTAIISFALNSIIVTIIAMIFGKKSK